VRRILPTLVAVSLLSGCVINNNKYKRPRDLEQSWFVDRARLLGVRAEPAEPRPGDSVTFSALLVDPNETIDSTLWIACPESDDADFGCLGDDQEIIGFEPLQPPAWTVPEDVLSELPEEERLEGRNILVQVTGLPPLDDLGDLEDLDLESLDFNEFEAGFKRIVVSEALTPNRNPDFVSNISVDQLDVPGDAVVEVDAGEAYDIGVFISDDTVEEYVFVNSDGIAEDRVEEPFVTWFATDGTVEEPYTLYPFLEMTWRAPDTSGVEGSIWAVLRDRRGGQDWKEIRFRVR
jgi:hypothetical protein